MTIVILATSRRYAANRADFRQFGASSSERLIGSTRVLPGRFTFETLLSLFF
jgi:hypothetical protein